MSLRAVERDGEKSFQDELWGFGAEEGEKTPATFLMKIPD